jgi:hypothetical protein
MAGGTWSPAQAVRDGCIVTAQKRNALFVLWQNLANPKVDKQSKKTQCAL